MKRSIILFIIMLSIVIILLILATFNYNDKTFPDGIKTRKQVDDFMTKVGKKTIKMEELIKTNPEVRKMAKTWLKEFSKNPSEDSLKTIGNKIMTLLSMKEWT